MTNRCFKCHPCLAGAFITLSINISFVQKWIWTQGPVFVYLAESYSCVWLDIHLCEKNSVSGTEGCLTRRGGKKKRKKMGHLFITLKICWGARVWCGQRERSTQFCDVCRSLCRFVISMLRLLIGNVLNILRRVLIDFREVYFCFWLTVLFPV